MKKKLLAIGIFLMLLLVGFSATGIKNTTVIKKDTTDKNYDYYPVMNLDSKTKEKVEIESSNFKEVFINPELEKIIEITSDYSILDLLEYIPEERNQGACPNCWAWPPTGIMGIALNVQEGIKDRLSVQFINTCGEEYNTFPKIKCCEPGSIGMFAAFYRAADIAIPWSNTMAHWHDGSYINCVTECDEIGKIPNYPISEITAERIEIHDVGEEEAINNIKNVLHQERGVYFSIYYPDSTDLNNFRDFWRNEDEQYIYDLDYYCGNDWVDEEAAGHALLLVGYHDEENSDENDYWIILNSWGVTDNRPNGIFLVDMHMNYDCTYSNYYAFGANTLNVTFGSDPEAPERPSIDGPKNGDKGTEYTYKISADDPEGDDVFLFVDWGDGTDSGWVGPVESGEEIEIDHTWSKKGDYKISAKAKDTEDKESFWSTLDVSMPKNKNRQLVKTLFDFFQNYPFIYMLIKQLLRV